MTSNFVLPMIGVSLSLVGILQVETLKDMSPISLLIISLGGIVSVVAMFKQNQLHIQQAKDNQVAMIQQSEYSQKLLADSLASQQTALIGYKLESDKGQASTFLKAFEALSKGQGARNDKEKA